MDSSPNPAPVKKDILNIGGQPAFFRTTSGQQQQQPQQLHHHQFQPRTPSAPSTPAVPANTPPAYTPPSIPTPPPSSETLTPASWAGSTTSSSGLKLPSRPAASPVVPETSSVFTSFNKQEEATLFKNLGAKETSDLPPKKEKVKAAPASEDPDKESSSVVTYVASGIVVLILIVGGIWAYIQFSYVNQRSIQANKKIDDQIKATDGIRSRLSTTQNDLALLNEKFNQSVQRQTELFEKQIEIALDQSVQKKQLTELQDQFRQQSELLKSQMEIIKQQPNLQKRLVEINNQIAQRQITLEKQVQSMTSSMTGSSSFSSAVINPSISVTPESNETSSSVPLIK